MHNENACEGHYSNSNKKETDYSSKVLFRDRLGESQIAALSVEYQRISDPVISALTLFFY